MERRHRVLIGACGSVATVKIPELVCLIAQHCEVRVILTNNANRFHHATKAYNPEAHSSFENMVALSEVLVYTDEDEWNGYTTVGVDPVVHIELRKWADVLLIAPLSANSLSKLANGIADNLISNVARAWDFSKPFVVAPAMNTFMWAHPFTGKHLECLESLGVKVVSPVIKSLACGDTGNGALAQVQTIWQTVEPLLLVEPVEPLQLLVLSPAPKQFVSNYLKLLNGALLLEIYVDDILVKVGSKEVLMNKIRVMGDPCSRKVVGIISEIDGVAFSCADLVAYLFSL